jgi:methionine-rich copper-binding protein CopC
MLCKYPAALAVMALFAASPAFAHAGLVESTPAKGATVAAPKSIKLTFSEKIAPAFSGLQLSMGDGMNVKAVTKVSADGMTLTATPTSPFMAGKWTLSWHAVSADDGHRTEGSFDFTVK